MLISTGSETGDIAAALADTVRIASASRTSLRIVGGDTKAFYGNPTDAAPLYVAGHSGVTDYEPSELVITARAGTRIRQIETLLASNGQRLAFDPPVFGESSTLGGIVAAGIAGPRRPFSGAVRDSILGVTVLNGNGQALRLGGTVFKNVAGFDGFRLMAGALGCLGVLLDISIRVAPIPDAEASLSFELDWDRARTIVIQLMRRPIPLSGIAHDGQQLHIRLSGATKAVAETASELGGEPTIATFWPDLTHRRLPILNRPRLWRLAVPRTARLRELPGAWLRDWAGGEVWLDSDADATLVRNLALEAGGHSTLYRGAMPGEDVFTPLPPSLLALHQRLKAAFDPSGIFNPGRMYRDL